MGCSFHLKITLPMGDLDPHLTRLLGSIQAHNPNGISIGSAIFCMDGRTVSLYFTMGCPFPLKTVPSNEGSGPHPIHSSLGPPESSTQTVSRSVQLFLQGSLVWQTDRQTGWVCKWVGFNVPLNTFYGTSGQDFTGQITHPTVSKHWRKNKTKLNQIQQKTSIHLN